MTVGGYCADVVIGFRLVDLINFSYITGSSCCFVIAY
jgi:hypothetical protein